jgi:hypothetical protein
MAPPKKVKMPQGETSDTSCSSSSSSSSVHEEIELTAEEIELTAEEMEMISQDQPSVKKEDLPFTFQLDEGVRKTPIVFTMREHAVFQIALIFGMIMEFDMRSMIRYFKTNLYDSFNYRINLQEAVSENKMPIRPWFRQKTFEEFLTTLFWLSISIVFFFTALYVILIIDLNHTMCMETCKTQTNVTSFTFVSQEFMNCSTPCILKTAIMKYNTGPIYTMSVAILAVLITMFSFNIAKIWTRIDQDYYTEVSEYKKNLRKWFNDNYSLGIQIDKNKIPEPPVLTDHPKKMLNIFNIVMTIVIFCTACHFVIRHDIEYEGYRKKPFLVLMLVETIVLFLYNAIFYVAKKIDEHRYKSKYDIHELVLELFKERRHLGHNQISVRDNENKITGIINEFWETDESGIPQLVYKSTISHLHLLKDELI